MAATKAKKFTATTVIEAGSWKDGERELRLEPGDEVTRDQLAAVGQSDEDIDYLVAGGSLEAA